MKKFIKWGLLLAFLAGAFWLGNLLWFKPFNLNHFVDREGIKFMMENPEALTQMRMFDKFGIKGHNRELNDASDAKGLEMFDRLEEIRATLNTYDDEDLSVSQLQTKAIMNWMLDSAVELKDFRHHGYPVNQLFGVQNGFPTFMESAHQIHSEGDAEDYIVRLTKVQTKFEQVLEGLKIREEKGIVPPTFVIEKVLEEMNNFVAQPVTENILYTSFVEKIAKVEDMEAATRESLTEQVAATIKSDVHPAYGLFIDYFNYLKPLSTQEAGVWKFPDGDKFYRLALKGYTTVDKDPEEIHNIGLAEVDRIQTEMLNVLAAEGYDPAAGFETVWQQVVDEERFYYPDTDQGRQQILEDYADIIEEIEAGMNAAFATRAQAEVVVKRIPEFKEKTAPGAYYQRPALDGSRPGTFYANLYDIKATPKFGMRTLAYHEAVPGHHWQGSISQELEDIPFIRTMLPFTAYSEGWALYSERLAWELGFQKDPFDNLGRLQAELFRAVRLVVDTGIHAKRWTREQAIDYMARNTGIAMTDVVSEIERYIVNPGQACAYKVGMMEILRLRAHAKQALGDRFDLREFHDVVLTNGAVPLEILGQLVDGYIESKS